MREKCRHIGIIMTDASSKIWRNNTTVSRVTFYNNKDHKSNLTKSEIAPCLYSPSDSIDAKVVLSFWDSNTYKLIC